MCFTFVSACFFEKTLANKGLKSVQEVGNINNFSFSKKLQNKDLSYLHYVIYN